VEGQTGLCRIESVGQITDASFTEAKALKNGEPGSIRQSMEQYRCAIGIRFELGSHVP
jgi:hypothetical protein